MRSLNRFTSALVVAVLVGGLVPADGSAQDLASSQASFVLLAWDAMPDAAARLIAEGDVALGNEDYGEARANYSEAAALIRAEGGFPRLALRRIADSYYFEERYQTAIAALDALAEEAADVGDVATQAWARADAAWVLWKDGVVKDRPVLNVEMRERTDKLRLLLLSPYLPDEDREEIRAKRCGGCHTAEMFAER